MTGQDHCQNPFVGLRPFESEDYLYYFGRRDQTRALLKQLHSNRFLAVIGSSGCGKSSLVRAGLISNLEAGFLVQDRDVWWIAKMKPSEAPLTNLATALLKARGGDHSPEQCAAFKERIQSQGVRLILEEFKAALDSAEANCFLLVDQFEELFRFAGDRANYEEAANFVAILQRLAEQTEAPFFVCLTMRSDFLGDCDRFNGLPETMNRSQYLVPRLTRQQRREAITGPARLVEVNIAPRLVDRLLNEEMDTRDDLPILQHALMRTWDEWVKEGGGVIDVEPYERIHTVKRALSVHADEALGELSEADQSLAKRVFQTLTETDAGNRRLRRPARLRELAEVCEAESERLRSIVEKFREKGRNFLVLSTEADHNNALVDISHESLIRQWDRLRGWVDEEAESAKIYRRLAETAALHRQGRAGLYRDADLQFALTWQEKEKPSPAWAKRYGQNFELTIEFLQASERKCKQDEAAVLVEQQRQLARVRRQRGVLAAALIAVCITVWSYWEVGRAKSDTKRAEDQGHIAQRAKLVAEREKQRADTQATLATKKAGEAESARTSAEKEKQRADEQAALATKRAGEAESARTFAEQEKQRADDQATLATKRAGEAQDATDKTAKAEKERTRDLFESYVTQATLLSRNEEFATASKGLQSSRALDNAISPERRHVRNLASWFTDLMGGVAEHVYEGAGGPLKHIAASPDGHYMVAVGEKGTVVLFDSNNQQPMKDLNGHTEAVNSVVFDPAGHWFATAGEDRRIIRWSLPDGELLSELSAGRSVAALAIGPDGSRLASGGQDSEITIWDIENRRALKPSLVGHSGAITALAFSPDGRILASASLDRTARIWNLHGSRLLGFKKTQSVLTGHSDGLFSVAFHPNGKILATGSSDRNVHVWDLGTGELLGILPGHKSAVLGLIFIGNGDTLVSASRDQTLRVWDWRSGALLRLLQGHAAGVTSVVAAEDNLYSASLDQTVRRWKLLPDASQPSSRLLTLAMNGTPESSAIVQDGSKIVVGMQNGNLSLLTLPGLQLVQSKEEAHRTNITRVAFNRDGTRLASASFDGEVKLWNVGEQSLQLQRTFGGHITGINSATFSPDGRILATASKGGGVSLDAARTSLTNTSLGGQIGLIDLQELDEQPYFFPAHGGEVHSVVFHPTDPHLLLSAGNDGRTLLWDVNTRPPRSLTEFAADQDRVVWAAFDPSGLKVATGGRSGKIRLFQARDGSLVTELAGHEDCILRVAFSPDSAQLVSAGADATVRFWDLEKKTEIISLRLPVKTGSGSPLWDFDFLGKSSAGDTLMAVPLTDGKLAFYNLGLIYE
jgi:WD40 repeat protein/energy-coupling factor transporter ATP-binding protein EcfA2